MAPEIINYQDRSCRCTVWNLPDNGWYDVVEHIDPFLAHAIKHIAAEYAPDWFQWLEINHWQDSGRLIVYPSQEGPFGNRGERIYFELSSQHLENESIRIGDAWTSGTLSESACDIAWHELKMRVWGSVEYALRFGGAALELAAARQTHPFWLACYDYAPGEDHFQLIGLDEEADIELHKQLAQFKQRHGVGA